MRHSSEGMNGDPVASMAPPRPRLQRSYFWLALTCFTVAVLGFTPTYFVGMAQGRFIAEPVVHVHGFIVFSWVTFFVVQTWLVATGSIRAHRTWGVLGISIITAMVLTTVAIVSIRVAQAGVAGQPANALYRVKAFSWVNIAGMAFIATAFTLAIVKVRQPEIHKRLMLLLTVSMLGAPIARWFIFFLAPARHGAAVLADGTPLAGAPPVFFSIPPSLLGDCVLIAAMIIDRRTVGRVHRVYWIGGAALLATQLTVVPIAQSAMWQAVAEVIGHLGVYSR